jgi:hypothetical protein
MTLLPDFTPEELSMHPCPNEMCYVVVQLDTSRALLGLKQLGDEQAIAEVDAMERQRYVALVNQVCTIQLSKRSCSLTH